MTTTATPFIPVLGAKTAADSIIERHRAALETMGPVFQATVPSRAAAGESEPRTLYHLSLAQTCFLTTKMATPSAERRTVLMAEVFALFAAGKLVAVDPVTACELVNAQVRESRPTA